MHGVAVLIDADRDRVLAAFDERGRRVVMLKIDDHVRRSSFEQISARRLWHAIDGLSTMLGLEVTFEGQGLPCRSGGGAKAGEEDPTSCSTHEGFSFATRRRVGSYVWRFHARAIIASINSVFASA